MLTNTKRLAWGHLSSMPFVVYLSHCEPTLSGLAFQVNHSIDFLPACQHVRAHTGVLERMGGLRRRESERPAHERLACCRDGAWRWPLENTVHIMLCPKEKKKAVQWRWNDPSGPAVMWHLCFPSLWSSQYAAQTFPSSINHMSSPNILYFWLLLSHIIN